MLLRPKIAQGGAIASSPDGHSTYHGVLRHKGDARVMAAEVPIVEVQAPLLEVNTWIAWRDFLANNPKPMERFEVGGEQCFDMAWCHQAKNDLQGYQGNPGVSQISYHEGSRELTSDDAAGRACLVLYQTPILHVGKRARIGLEKTHEFLVATQLLCRYFRLELGTVERQGLKAVYELFVAPKPG